MKKFFVLPAVLGLLVLGFIASPAGANYRGPIVSGEERREYIFFCHTEEAAMLFATQEEASIKARETVKDFLAMIQHMQTKKRCEIKFITYTPKETIYQYMGWGGPNPTGLLQWSMVRALRGEKTIYAIVRDKVPLPKIKHFLSNS